MITKEYKKEEFIRMYREMDLTEFLEEVGISFSTLYRMLDRYDIPRNRDTRQHTKVTLT